MCKAERLGTTDFIHIIINEPGFRKSKINSIDESLLLLLPQNIETYFAIYKIKIIF